jgi:hypothetical protein
MCDMNVKDREVIWNYPGFKKPIYLFLFYYHNIIPFQSLLCNRRKYKMV